MTWDRRQFGLGSLAAVAALAGGSAARAAPAVLVAAASDLQLALPDVVRAFHAETGITVNVSYGSTGNFARQIRQGAPFQIFLAADESFVTALAADQVIADTGAVYAEGRLSLIATKRSAFADELTLGNIAGAARERKAFRFAIANPEHAPYGKRALEVLERWSVDELLRPRLVFGENVTQALQMVASGAADVGIVARAIARAPAVAHAIVDQDVPADWHKPLIQRMVLTRKATDPARQFYTFLLMPAARAILARHGFTLPGGLG